MRERTCLIVDDEPAVRAFLSDVLRANGMQSLEANNAVEALRVLRKPDRHIDLLITDIHMPGRIDGIDLAKSVKRLFPLLPVIMVSGHSDQAPIGLAVVQKPFTLDAILDAINKIMRRPKPKAKAS